MTDLPPIAKRLLEYAQPMEWSPEDGEEDDYSRGYGRGWNAAANVIRRDVPTLVAEAVAARESEIAGRLDEVLRSMDEANLAAQERGEWMSLDWRDWTPREIADEVLRRLATVTLSSSPPTHRR